MTEESHQDVPKGLVDPHGRALPPRPVKEGRHLPSCDGKKERIRPGLGGNAICMGCGEYQNG